MNHPVALHFVTESSKALLETLSRTWLDATGTWRLLATALPDVAALRALLTQPGPAGADAPTLLASDAFTPGALVLNHTDTHTLEVDSATPLQSALTLHATNGQDSASTRLWLQVDRFEGLTRVGTDGDDRLLATGGYANLLAGGHGSDTYVVRDGSDVVFENAGEGIDTVIGLDLSHELAEHVENLTLAHSGDPVMPDAISVHGTGNALNNEILGHQRLANVLDGRAGADLLWGGAGSDTYVVDDAGDAVRDTVCSDVQDDLEPVIADAGGNDLVISSVGFSLMQGERVQGRIEHLRLTGSADIDGTGNAADNSLQGNAGRNVLDGGAGSDTVVLDAALDELQFLRHSNGSVLVGHRDPQEGQADVLINVEKLQIAATGEVIDLNTLAMPTVLDYLAQHPEVAAQAGGGNEAAAAAHYLSQGQQQGLTTEIHEVSVPIGGAGGPGSGPIVMPPISQWVDPGVAQWGVPLGTGASTPLAAGASDLQVLSATALAQLIDAMASVAPPSAGSTPWQPQPGTPLQTLGVWG